MMRWNLHKRSRIARSVITIAVLLPGMTLPFGIAQAASDEAQLVINSQGHMALIRSLQFTADGKFLLTASEDKTVIAWDVDSGTLADTFRGQIGPGDDGKLEALAVRPGDKLLAVGGRLPGDKGAIRLIDFISHDTVALLRGHREFIESLAFSHDGKLLLSGSRDGSARIWDVAARRCLYELKHYPALPVDGEPGAIARFYSNDERVVTAGRDGVLRLWQVSTGRELTPVPKKMHSKPIRAITATPDGKYLLSGGEDGAILEWNAETGEFSKKLIQLDNHTEARTLLVSGDGKRVLVGSRDNVSAGIPGAAVYSYSSGALEKTFAGNDNSVFTADLSPKGWVATAGGSDLPIFLWDPASGRVLHEWVGAGARIYSVGFSPDGTTIGWGKTLDNDTPFPQGPLQFGFRLRDADGYHPRFQSQFEEQPRYGRGIAQVGATKIRTADGTHQKILEILRDGKVVHTEIHTNVEARGHASLTLTVDGRTAISGSWRGVITTYDVASGKRLKDFVGHTGSVLALAPSPDGRWLVSGSVDQTVRLWDIASRRLLLSIFHAKDNEWVAWIPEGYYASSSRGDQYIGWHINRGIDQSPLYAPASSYAKRFYNPRIVAHYLETNGDIREAIKRANLEHPEGAQTQLTTPKQISRVSPPTVHFQEPAEPGSHDTVDPTILVRAKAESVNGLPISDLWLQVNGARVLPRTGPDGSQDSTPQYSVDRKHATITASVNLRLGENTTVEVLAKNDQSNADTDTFTIVRQRSALSSEEPEALPNLYFLAIGVTNYRDPKNNLSFADKDAEALFAFFKKQQGRAFAKVEARLLTNDQATKEALEDQLDWLSHTDGNTQDVSILFLAGHGVIDSKTGDYFFLPYDGDTDRLNRRAVIWATLTGTLSGLHSRVLFLVDTCHGGAVVAPLRDAKQSNSDDELMKSRLPNVNVLAASLGDELSQERSDWGGGHGAFTFALLEGLEQPGGSVVTVLGLRDFVSARVKELTAGAKGAQEVFKFTHDPVNFALAKNSESKSALGTHMIGNAPQSSRQ